MSTTATATYFFKTNYGTSGLRTGTLADDDLTRGDDAREAVLPSSGPALFDGIDTLTFDSQGRVTFVKTPGEVIATVTFADGTSIAGVRALQDIITGPYGEFNQYFLVDSSALAAAGKTMADVVDVTRLSDTDHSLNWSDFGFSRLLKKSARRSIFPSEWAAAFSVGLVDAIGVGA